MSNQVSGVIQEIQSRSVAGGKTAYNLVIAGTSYGAGLFKPKAEVGQYVTFTVQMNGNFKNVERGTLKVSDYKPQAQDAAPAKSAVKQAVGSYDSRQDTISRQAAANTAIEWLGFLATAGALPAAKNKGAAQAAFDAMREEYEKYFYERNTGNEWKDISPNPTTYDGAESEEDASPEDVPWE